MKPAPRAVIPTNLSTASSALVPKPAACVADEMPLLRRSLTKLFDWLRKDKLKVMNDKNLQTP